MSKVLTQEELDALLRSASEIQRSIRKGSVPGADGAVRYNFRRPDRVSKEQIRSLQFLHDRFARNVATSLAAYLRTATEVSLRSVEQCTYAEFLRSLPDPTAYYALQVTPVELTAAFELNPAVAFGIIDRMLGGAGHGVTLARALTEIEQSVIDGAVRLIADTLTETWRSRVDVQFKVTARETRPQMLQVTSPNEVVVHLAFDVRVGEAKGLLNVCVPAAALETLGASFVKSRERARQDPSQAERQHLAANLARVSVPVSAVLETSLPAGELLSLKAGDVLALGRSVREPVDLVVRSTVKFKGRLVARDGTSAVLVEREQVVAAESRA
jgi:flagellar motor switch protein FliM